MKYLFNLLFDNPNDVSAPDSGRGKPHSVEEDLAFLREGKKEDPPEDTDDADDTDAEDTDNADDVDDTDVDADVDTDAEDAEDTDEEDKEPTDEEINTKGFVTVKDITKDFPEFFKKHPEVRGIIYRERQYSELFAKPEEAQVAITKADTLDRVNADIAEGNIKPVFEAVKNNNPEAFNKIVADILPALKALDETTYMKLMAVPLKRALRTAVAEGLRSKNNNLVNSAGHLHQFIFGDDDINGKTEFESTESKKTPEQEKYEKRLQDLDVRDRGNFKISVDSEWLGAVKTTFMDKLDPDNLLSDWTKDKMFEDCVVKLNEELIADPRYMKTIESLWRTATASGYNSESKSRIVNTALARAKQIIPELRARLRSEALNERRKRVVGNKDKKKFEVVSRGEKKPVQKNRSNPRSTSSMSELDAIRS